MLSSFFCVDTTMQKRLPMKTLKKLPSKLKKFSLTAQTTQKVKCLFSNVAYRATVYKTAKIC